jgi:hypothetical protein
VVVELQPADKMKAEFEYPGSWRCIYSPVSERFNLIQNDRVTGISH